MDAQQQRWFASKRGGWLLLRDCLISNSQSRLSSDRTLVKLEIKTTYIENPDNAEDD